MNVGGELLSTGWPVLVFLTAGGAAVAAIYWVGKRCRPRFDAVSNHYDLLHRDDQTQSVAVKGRVRRHDIAYPIQHVGYLPELDID